MRPTLNTLKSLFNFVVRTSHVMSIAFVLSSDRVSKLGLSDICIFDIIIFVFFGYTTYSIFFRQWVLSKASWVI